MPDKNEKQPCEHHFEYMRSDSFYCMEGRNTYAYYHTDYFFCTKCTEEKVKEKRHSCYTGDRWQMPNWAKSITKKVNSHLNIY